MINIYCYVTELTKHIKMKSNKDENDDRTYVRFLPSFVWAVRDFSLDLELDGKPITADEYLENGLKDKPGKENQQYNEPRLCLRKFFLHRSCFVFERPANYRRMQRLEELTDADLDEDFVEQIRKLTEHIYTKSETKTFSDGIKVTGRLLGQLAETYVKAIRSGEVPCLENAVKALAEIENAIAVEQAQLLYVQRMKSVRFPTNTLEELSAIHESSEREALALFMKLSFRDDNQEYQKKLVSILQGEYNQICEKNLNESRKACEQIIKRVFKPLEDNLGAGFYTVPGGYKKYIGDVNVMTAIYRREGGRRFKAEEVLKTYLDEKAIVAKALRAADRNLSEAQRRQEEDKAKWEKSERERRAMEEQQMVLERQMADRQRTQEENMRQLQEKMEEEKAKWKKSEHEMVRDRQRAEENVKQRKEKMVSEQDETDLSTPILTHVSLFYTPPIDDDPISTLDVLLLPKKVVLDEVINRRRKKHGDEIYIEKPPCKLYPNKKYTLSTSPADDSIRIEPNHAMFEVEESSYHNYTSTFQVILQQRCNSVTLCLKEYNTSVCAWEGCVHLSRRKQVQCAESAEEDKLFLVRSSFINSISDANLNNLLDKLLDKRVITDSEWEMAAGKQGRIEKARCVIDTVRNKGASSSMILILRDIDPCLSKHLGLM